MNSLTFMYIILQRYFNADTYIERDFVDFLYFFNTNDIKYIQIFRYSDILRLHAI